MKENYTVLTGFIGGRVWLVGIASLLVIEGIGSSTLTTSNDNEPRTCQGPQCLALSPIRLEIPILCLVLNFRNK